MERNSLTSAQISELKQAHRKEMFRKHADRIKVILYLNRGLTYEEVAQLLLIDDATVRRYEKNYLENGTKGLFTCLYKGKQRFLSDNQLEEFKVFLDSNPISSTKQAREYIKNQFNVSYSLEGTRKLLLELGYSYRKPQVRPAKLDTDKQDAHIKKYEEIKSNLNKENASIYFLDAVHPTMNAKPAHGWMRKGSPKVLLTSASRKRLNIHGAVDLQNQDSINLSFEKINSTSTIALLTKIRDKNYHKRKVYVILDNAKVHHSKKVKAWLEWNKKIELVFLPAYSPNLNPIERLWKHMNKKVIDNVCFNTFDEFKFKILKFLRTMHRSWDQLSSLLTDNFQTYSPL